MLLSILAASPSLTEVYARMKPALILLFLLLAVLFICSIAFTLVSAQIKTRRRERTTQKTILSMLYVTTVVVLICTCICFVRYRTVGKAIENDVNIDAGTTDSTDNTGSKPTENPSPSTSNAESETTAPSTEPVPDPTFTPALTDGTNPDKWGITWEIIQNGEIVENYQRPEPISFGKPEDYFALPGISTFRGNNFRNNASYGTATVTEKEISEKWANYIDSFNGWTGAGWTGQPLIVKWDEETKAHMNLYPSKKTKEGLVEVIYATLDGRIYFYDLDDGSYTRDSLFVGMNFKGAGSLDPRGYPILYVGSGDYLDGTTPRMYIISLIDCSILYQRSGNDAFSQRSWAAFDSSPLIDTETDSLIWPGESGILYTIKLNTAYDKAAGTLTMNPEEAVKNRYYTERSSEEGYWIGYEPSCIIVDRYLYISENGGMFFCIDLNTMELVWAQDTRDDSNSTPVFEWDGTDGGFIYTAPSLHWTNTDGSGYICIYKLNAKTGEVVWEQKFDCKTVDGVSGGVQSSPLMGKDGTELEGLILYTIARTPGYWDGKLVAFDRETGEIVWQYIMDCYTWSSPVAAYDENGKAYILVGDSVGTMVMLDGKGNVLDSMDLGSNIEASPAIYENTMVIGTRGQVIYGIKIQ